MTVKTDLELLKLAAKAAGLPLCSEWDAATEGILIGEGNGDLKVWNPLTDDGDALRLAVKLNINVFIYDDESSTATRGVVAKNWGSKEENTRRAIVRTAADIGETL